jgi:hypothetical protein
MQFIQIRNRRFLHLLMLFSLGLNPYAQAQERKSSNSIILELAGTGGYGSFNYERKIIHFQEQFNVFGRIGLSTYNLLDFERKLNPDLIIPIALIASYGEHHQILLGAGQTFSSIPNFTNGADHNKRLNNFTSHVLFGYRLQSRKSPFMWSMTYTPILYQNRFFRHWAGLSIGYNL